MGLAPGGVGFRKGTDMKIRLLTGVAGPEGSFAPGEVRTVADAEGRAWCEAGLAEPVAVAPRKRAETRRGSKKSGK